MHVEHVKSTLLAVIQGPSFAAIKQSAEHAGYINVHLGFRGQHSCIYIYIFTQKVRSPWNVINWSVKIIAMLLKRSQRLTDYLKRWRKRQVTVFHSADNVFTVDFSVKSLMADTHAMSCVTSPLKTGSYRGEMTQTGTAKHVTWSSNF